MQAALQLLGLKERAAVAVVVLLHPQAAEVAEAALLPMAAAVVAVLLRLRVATGVLVPQEQLALRRQPGLRLQCPSFLCTPSCELQAYD